EDLAGPEDGEGLFSHPADLAKDAHFALDDDVKLVARVAVAEEASAGGVGLFGRDLGDHREGLGREPLEERHLRELRLALGAHFVAASPRLLLYRRRVVRHGPRVSPARRASPGHVPGSPAELRVPTVEGPAGS